MSKLESGRFYTMSVMKHRCGDRSWSHDIWEVLATNETHALIKNAAPRYKHSFGYDPHVVMIDDFDWTPAHDLVGALADYAPVKDTTHG